MAEARGMARLEWLAGFATLRGHAVRNPLLASGSARTSFVKRIPTLHLRLVQMLNGQPLRKPWASYRRLGHRLPLAARRIHLVKSAARRGNR
jgi:hypothetical protein